MVEILFPLLSTNHTYANVAVLQDRKKTSNQSRNACMVGNSCFFCILCTIYTKFVGSRREITNSIGWNSPSWPTQRFCEGARAMLSIYPVLKAVLSLPSWLRKFCRVPISNVDCRPWLPAFEHNTLRIHIWTLTIKNAHLDIEMERTHGHNKLRKMQRCNNATVLLDQDSETYGPRAGCGLPSKIIRPADPLQIVVTPWPA